MKRWFGLALVCMVIGGLMWAGCAKSSIRMGKSAEDGTPKLKVVASFYPMYEFAKQVGQDKIDIQLLVPAGVEPHDWEPTPRDMAALQRANVFVYNGAGFEHWVGKALQNMQNQNPSLIAVETSSGLELVEAIEEHEHGNAAGEATAETAQVHVGEKDPHVWLDPVAAQHQVNMIKEALIKADPVNQSYYTANAAQYNAKLAALDQEYKTGLANTRQRKFITSHAAFGYLAKRYNLEQIAIVGLAPHAEPMPERMKSLVDEAQQHHIKYIFFETLASPKVAEIIAQAVGAGTLVLNPLEGLTPEDISQGKDYIALMKENLANLQLALEAK